MKIYFSKNKQHFCCNNCTIKEKFIDTDIHVSFGVLSTQYCTSIHDKNHYFYKKNIRGQVIASIQMVNSMSSAILSFYAIKTTAEKIKIIQDKFSKIILPEIYAFYIKHLELPLDNHEYILLVDLVDDDLKIKLGTL